MDRIRFVIGIANTGCPASGQERNYTGTWLSAKGDSRLRTILSEGQVPSFPLTLRGAVTP